METYSETLISPSKIKEMVPSGISLGIGDEFFISRLQEKPQYAYLRYPFRVDCYLAAYCVEGSVNCSVNLTDYHLTTGTLLLITPGNIVKITQPEELDQNLRVTLIAVNDQLFCQCHISSFRNMITLYYT
jgi:hypothetical protein